MAHVGSVDPWSAGDGGLQPEADPASGRGSAHAPSDGLAGQTQADLLMGFLNDFHAAGREPEPAPEPVRAVPSTTSASYLSRFDFVPPDPLDVVEDLPPAAPLPVWPPPPDTPAPAPAASSVEPPAAVSPRPPAAPQLAEDQGERRGVGVFRRLGRR